MTLFTRSFFLQTSRKKIFKALVQIEKQNAWMIRNMNAAGVIYSYVSEPIQTLIRADLSSSVAMWATLKTHFSQDNAASRVLVLDEFLSMSKGEE